MTNAACMTSKEFDVCLILRRRLAERLTHWFGKFSKTPLL